MTALPLRPALADVLSVVTDTLPAQWSPESYRVTVVNPAWVGRRHPPQGMGVDGGVPLSITDPHEAFEALIARGVLPDAFAGDVRRAFACPVCGGAKTVPAVVGTARVWCRGCTERCETCGGTGSVTITTGDGSHGTLEPATCDDCDAGYRSDTSTGYVAHPPTIPALVAWASLGPAAILRAEELARETVARLRPWGAPQPERVMWRAGERGGADRVACALGDIRVYADGRWPCAKPDHYIGAVMDIWRAGLALESITADGVTIVVPARLWAGADRTAGRGRWCSESADAGERVSCP